MKSIHTISDFERYPHFITIMTEYIINFCDEIFVVTDLMCAIYICFLYFVKFPIKIIRKPMINLKFVFFAWQFVNDGWEISALGVIKVDGLVQEGRNSIANALELRLSCTSPWKCNVTG